MALHRPDAIKGEHQSAEGEKTVQKAVAKRTVDYSGPYLLWREQCPIVRNPYDAPIMSPVPAAAIGLLPPIAYTHCPATNFPVMFAAQAPSKTRTSINAVQYTPDGRRCLAGTQAGEFTLWDSSTFSFESIIQGHESPVRTMAFTRHGRFFVTGDDGGAVHYRSTKTGLELVKAFTAHREAIRGIAFAPGDLKFTTGSDDSTVRIWDFAKASTESVLAGHGGDVRCVDWHPTRGLVVSGSKDTLVKLWDPRSGGTAGTLHGHKATLMTTQWNPTNGNWVLTASRDQTCKVFDIRFQQRELATFKGHDSDVTTAVWHPIQEELFASGANDGSLSFWLVGRAAPQARVPINCHEGPIWSLAWHPAGHLLASGSGDATLKFWCRARPGDPFLAQQRRAQREALGEEEGGGGGGREEGKQPSAKKMRTESAATFKHPAVTRAIPGIGDAVSIPGLGKKGSE